MVSSLKFMTLLPCLIFPSTSVVVQTSDAHLCIAFVLVPDEAQLGVCGHGVVGSDVAVEQGTFNSNRLTSQYVVLLQIHRPVNASIHCEGEHREEKYWGHTPLYTKYCRREKRWLKLKQHRKRNTNINSKNKNPHSAKGLYKICISKNIKKNAWQEKETRMWESQRVWVTGILFYLISLVILFFTFKAIEHWM